MEYAMKRYAETWDDWGDDFADAIDSDLDALFDVRAEQSPDHEAIFADDDSDKLWSLKQMPSYVTQPPVADIPSKFRNIGYGEITATSPQAARVGLANLNQDLIYRERRQGARGRPTLVQYDPQGNVIMRILSDDHRRILWQGTIGTIRMPTTPDAARRGREAEARVRRLVAQATGRRFRRHAPAAGGADLVAVRRTQQGRRRMATAMASPRGVVRRPVRSRRAVQRFDVFDDVLDDVEVL